VLNTKALSITLPFAGTIGETSFATTATGDASATAWPTASQRQAGEWLDLSTGAAVSMQLKSLPAAVASKSKLRRQLTAIEKAMRTEISKESEAPDYEN